MSSLADYLKNTSYEFIDFIELSDEEKRMVWNWRNNIKIRQWMYNKELIEWYEHLKFLERLKQDATKKYFLVKRNKEHIGASYMVEIKDGVAELGYYISPDSGKMLGLEFAYFTLRFLFDTFGMKKLYAYSLRTNRAVNSLNSLLGFSKEPVIKTVNNEPVEYFYREISYDKWNTKTREDEAIEKLLLLYFR